MSTVGGFLFHKFSGLLSMPFGNTSVHRAPQANHYTAKLATLAKWMLNRRGTLLFPKDNGSPTWKIQSTVAIAMVGRLSTGNYDLLQHLKVLLRMKLRMKQMKSYLEQQMLWEHHPDSMSREEKRDHMEDSNWIWELKSTEKFITSSFLSINNSYSNKNTCKNNVVSFATKISVVAKQTS